MLGRHTDEPDDQDARTLNTTLFAQPALFTIEYAMTPSLAIDGGHP